MLNIYPYIIYNSIYKKFSFFFILFLLMVLVILCLYPEIFYLMTNGSDSGGGLTPGGGNGGPSGGGPNGPGPEVTAVAGGGIPHSDTQGSLNSKVSYSSNDLRNVETLKKMLQDKTLTLQELHVIIDKLLIKSPFEESLIKLINENIANTNK